MTKSITIEDDLDSFYTTVDDVNSAIRTANATYHSDLVPISSAVDTFSFGTWNDEVQQKLKQSFEDDLRGGVWAIEDDFSEGGFKKLLDTMKELDNDAYMAVSEKKNYIDLKNKRKNEPEKVTNAAGEEVANSKRPTENQVNNAKKNAQYYIDNVNKELLLLSQLEFGGTGEDSDSSQPPAVNETQVPFSEPTHQNSALDREEFSYDGGRKKITIQMADDDSITGNMYWTQYGSPVNKTKNIQVMMGEDGKYYEYVTYIETDSWSGKETFRETTRRELAGDPTTITFTTTNADGDVVGETTISVCLDSELGQLGYNQMLIDSGIDSGLYLTSTFGDGATVNLPDGRTVTVRSEGGSGEWHQPRNGQTIDRNDPTLTVVTPDADGKMH